MMKDVLAVDPVSTGGGVTVWIVPPAGVTPTEPPPDPQIVTTPP
jgi:hypothetical protein